MSDWKEYKLGELIEIKYGKNHQHLADGKFPLYGSGGIMRYVEKPIYEKETILIPRKGTLTNLFYVNEPFWAVDTIFWSKIDASKAVAKFIFYVLKTHDLASLNVGSAVPSLTTEVLNDVSISIPEIPYQHQIVEVLSSIDNKIDLLHTQNKTLEELAETLFRQWFVEEAEDSWKKGKLNDILKLEYGKTLKEQTRSGVGYPVIGSGGVVGYHSEYLVEKPGIVIGRKGTLGNVNYQFENFFPIDTTFYIKSNINSVGLYFEYFQLKILNLEEQNSDSAVPGLNRDIAHSLEVRIPPLQKIKTFNNTCVSFFEKIKSNSMQIRTLIKLRENLLPKLMSGEVKIKL